MLLFPRRIRDLVYVSFGNRFLGEVFLEIIERSAGVSVEDEGMLIVPSATRMNFTGNVNVTSLNGVPQVQILGGGGGSSTTGVISNTYDAKTNVGTGVNQLIASSSADADDFLQKISCSATNLTDFTVQVNGVTIEIRRSSYSAFGNVDFDFTGYPGLGLPLVAGDVVSVYGTQYGLDVCDMNARIQFITQTS